MNVDKIVSDYFREQKINRIAFPVIGIIILLLGWEFDILCISLGVFVILFVIAGEIISHYRTDKALTDILYEDCKAEKYWSVFSALYGKSKGRKQKQESYIHIIQGLYAIGKLEDMEQMMDAYEGKDQLSSRNKINVYLYRIYLNSEINPKGNPKLIQEFQEFLGSFKFRKYLKKKGEDALNTCFLLERIKQNPSQKDLELLENKMRMQKSNYERFSLMYCLGRGYLKFGNQEKAKNYISQVAGVDSDLPFAHEARGLLQKEFGKTVELSSFQNDKRRNRKRFIRRKKGFLIIFSCCFLFVFIIVPFYHALVVIATMDKEMRELHKKDRPKTQVEQNAEKIDGELYYDSIQNALKNSDADCMDDAESYMCIIDRVVLRKEKGKYITLFYEAQKKKDDSSLLKTKIDPGEKGDFCLVMTKLETRENEGKKRYRIIYFNSENMLTEFGWNLRELSRDIVYMGLSRISKLQNEHVDQDLVGELWGVCNSKKIYRLRVNGKVPDSIVPIDKKGRVFYLWYYDDVGDIPDASKVSVEYAEPEATNP